MAAAAEVPAGGTIVDCPCGAGPALRAIPTTGAVDYVGVDLSPSMIRRARERAAAHGLSNSRFLEANAADLPLSSAGADLFFSFWGLHCFGAAGLDLTSAKRSGPLLFFEAIKHA